jgi:hypothetical protein
MLKILANHKLANPITIHTGDKVIVSYTKSENGVVTRGREPAAIGCIGSSRISTPPPYSSFTTRWE